MPSAGQVRIGLSYRPPLVFVQSFLIMRSKEQLRFATTHRRGPRPKTTPTNPHTQLDQNAPAHLQAALFDHAGSLAGVRVGESGVSVPGARAFHLDNIQTVKRDAFLVEREFAHLHPPYDGSLHAALPPQLVQTAIDNGWAELHPLAGRFGLPSNIVMIYGPRDAEELSIVTELVNLSHAYATGVV
jgi:phospholipase/carboxylesterase